MRPTAKPSSPLALTSASLFFSIWILDILFLNRNYQYDSLQYMVTVRDANAVTDLFHPHHLLFNPLLWLLKTTLSAVAPGTDPLVPTQCLLAVVGAAGGLVFFHLCRLTLPLSRRDALLTALLLATSYGYWHYSSEVEPYVPALAAATAAVFVLRRAMKTLSARAAAAVALLHASAVLLHQVHVFLTPVLLGLIAFAEAPKDRRYRFSAIYLGVLALSVGGLYLWAAKASGIDFRLAPLFDWSTSYAQSGRWGGLRVESFYYGLGGAFTAVIGKGLLQRFVNGIEWTAAVGAGVVSLVLTAAALIWLLLSAVRQRSRIFLEAPFLARYCLFSAIAYVPFLVWWEPYNLEHWIALLPALWVAVALAARLGSLPAGLSRAALPALLVMVAGFNLTGDVGREARIEHNEYQLFTSLLAKESGPDDLVVAPIPQVSVYGDYFFGTRFRRMALHELPARKPDFKSNCDVIDLEIKRTRASGHRVFLAEHEMEPPSANLKQLSKFSRAEYRRCYAGYENRLEPLFEYRWLDRRYTLFELGPSARRVETPADRNP